ncbi:GIY-YIG nuclease family protein [Flavobacterium sp.]
MSHFIYILYSETTSKYYIGESYNLDERIKKSQSTLLPKFIF